MMNLMNYQDNTQSLLKDALINWKNEILTSLEQKIYYKKPIYLIPQTYLDDFEKISANCPNNAIDLSKNSIFKESNNLYALLNSQNINIRNLPRIFPLNKHSYYYFKILVRNKDNNDIQDSKCFPGEFKEAYLEIAINQFLYLFYFNYNGHIRQGFLKIKNPNLINDILFEFEINGPLFFIKNKTGKNINDIEFYSQNNDFDIYIFGKSEYNIEKIRKEFEMMKESKINNLCQSMQLPANNFYQDFIQKTAINLLEAKNNLKKTKLTNIFGQQFKKRKNSKYCGVGINNIFPEGDEEQKIEESIQKNQSLSSSSLGNSSNQEIYLSNSMVADNNNNINNENNEQNQLFLMQKRSSTLSTLSIDEPLGGLIGLNNIGATCYMNATLQCFSNIEFLRSELLNPDFYNDLEKNQQKKRLSFALAEVLKNLWLKFDDKKSYSPENFKQLISEMNPLFRGIQANDPKDLILFILETMHSELRTINPQIQTNNNFIPNEHNLQEVYQDFANYYLSKNKSIIFDIFFGCTNIVTTCNNCKSEIHNVQVNNIIFFPLEEVRKFKNKNTNTPVNLIDCFEYNQRSDIYYSYFCNACHNNNTTANSYTRYLFTPRVLVINLNRGKGIQFNVKIDFDEYLDIKNFVFGSDSPYKYELIGVICHFGESGMSGHFIAFCKHFSFKGNKWYKFNDGFVDECTFDNVKKSGMPYVLFYSYLDVDESQ